MGADQGEGLSLNRLGAAYYDLGQYEKAIEYSEKSLSLYREVKDRQGEVLALNVLGNTTQNKLNPRRNLPLNIFWSKQAVNILQSIRRDIAGMDKDTQKGYLRFYADNYRNLADVLLEQGRVAEALQVLALLKDDEQFEFLRQRKPESGKADVDTRVTLALSPEEETARTAYAMLVDQLTTLGTERAALDDKQKRYMLKLETADANRLTSVTAELGAADMAFDAFVKGLPARFPRDVPVTVPSAAQAETVQTQAYLKSLRAAKGSDGAGEAAFVALLVGDQRTWIVVTTETEQFAVSSEVTADALSAKVLKLRSGLLDPALDPRPLGKQVYDLLLKPVEAKLAAAKIQTLLVSLDGTVRYLPLAALSPNGKTYLLEKYRLASVTPRRALALVAPISPTAAAGSVLGLGVTRAYDVTLSAEDAPLHFGALPGVKEEVAAVTASAGSKALLDDQFSSATLLGGETSGFTTVHIASHFRIGADIYRSFLLTGDGKALTLSQMLDAQGKTGKRLFAGVDFLLLSACDTATGDLMDARGKSLTGGREVDSFALVAQEQGAQAILATLWPVADSSTVALMREFYRLRRSEPDLAKPEALRRAQVALIHGKLAVTGDTTATKGAVPTVAPRDAAPDNDLPPYTGAKWAHPYYWAPFVLIGNVR